MPGIEHIFWGNIVPKFSSKNQFNWSLISLNSAEETRFFFFLKKKGVWRFHVVVKWKNMIGSLSSGIWTTLQGAKFKKISSKSILSFQNKHFGRQFFKKIFADHVLYMKNITLSSRQRLLIFVFTSIVFCFVSGVRSWTRKPFSCLIGRSGRVTVPSSSCFIWTINKLINKRVTKKIVRTETVIWHYY